jgi:TolB protein
MRLLLVGFAALLAGTASAAGSGKNGLIAFGACCGEDVGIYVVKPVGGGLKRIYKPPFDDADLTSAWSPNGKRLAYVAPGGVWTMSATGSGRTRLTKGKGGAGDPTWSADGRQIAFSDLNRAGGRRYDIYVIGSDGNGLKKIIGSPRDDNSPAWSPNGKQILFERDGNLWVSSASGRSQRRLRAGGSPAWAPDGKRIAFDYRGDLWVASANGTSARRVAVVSSGTAGIAWSPDGSLIAYASGDRGDVLLVHPDGTGSRHLTHKGDLFHSWPTWQRAP